MKIVANGLFLTRPGSGVGQYTRYLLEAYAAAFPDDSLVVVLPEDVAESFPFETVIAPPPRGGRGGIALDFWERQTIPYIAGELKADLIFSPHVTAPLRTELPYVMTVHDVIPWRMPGYQRGLRKRLRAAAQRRGIISANHVITVSEFSRTEIVSEMGISEQNITVAYESTNPDYDRPATPRAKALACTAFALERPFIAYIGGFDPRKNIPALMRAFADSGVYEQYDLVVMGEPPHDRLYSSYRDIPKRSEALGISGAVRRIGFVTEQHKHALLSAAEAVVFPSSYEGFGLPMLEGIRAGTPVIAPNTVLNTELFPDAYHGYPPNQSTALARLLRSLPLSVPKQATRAARRYSWPDSAAKVREAFEQATSKKPVAKRGHRPV